MLQTGESAEPSEAIVGDLPSTLPSNLTLPSLPYPTDTLDTKGAGEEAGGQEKGKAADLAAEGDGAAAGGAGGAGDAEDMVGIVEDLA